MLYFGMQWLKLMSNVNDEDFGCAARGCGPECLWKGGFFEKALQCRISGMSSPNPSRLVVPNCNHAQSFIYGFNLSGCICACAQLFNTSGRS